MPIRTFKSDSLLLTTAAIWGFAFVAQRLGMQYLGPFTFNGIRFLLGSFSLLPLLFINRCRETPSMGRAALKRNQRADIVGGILAGVVLFAGASLQQVGIVHTTAGKAGFITGLYVVLVPILGLCFGQRTGAGTWIGVLLAAWGLYFLSLSENFTMTTGDLLVLLGAFFWAAHVLILGWLSPKIYPVRLAFFQFAICSLLSLITGFIVEMTTLEAVLQAAGPILYGGFFSVGVAYTLQVFAQREARPAHAAIILSLETAFAALGGWLILGEVLSRRGIVGCSLMLAGMLISQFRGFLKK